MSVEFTFITRCVKKVKEKCQEGHYLLSETYQIRSPSRYGPPAPTHLHIVEAKGGFEWQWEAMGGCERQ